jgi:hypothetical protein
MTFGDFAVACNFINLGEERRAPESPLVRPHVRLCSSGADDDWRPSKVTGSGKGVIPFNLRHNEGPPLRAAPPLSDRGRHVTATASLYAARPSPKATIQVTSAYDRGVRQ